MITRREFTKFGLGAAGIAAGAKAIISAQKDSNAFPTVVHQPEWSGIRRVGIRPNGTYWGGRSEQIDVLSGNLNYSLPMLIAGGRGANVGIVCSYNSQLWERDNPTTISHGTDTGVGYGWCIQFGAIIPQYVRGNVAGYLFISDTGAEFPLSFSRGVWVSLQGLFISYDPSKRVLQFPDGTFWDMDCQSASGEVDVGALYPTAIVDRNGNQILISYMIGAGAQQKNTSSRIEEIQDSRAADTESGHKTYSFTYDTYGTEVVPHLISITSYINRDENYHFSYDVQRVSSPYGGNGNKNYEFVHVLKNIQQEGHPPQVFEYSQSGELEQAQLPYGARFRWEYETINNKGMVRAVNRRGLILAAGKEESVWTFSSKQNNGRNARRVTTLSEPQGMAKRIWSFDADLQSTGCGLLSTLEENDNNRTLRLTAYEWKSTVAGAPYIGTIVTALDPGTADEATSKEEFDRDLFGNLTENRKYDYGNPLQPIRVIRNTYLTDPAYIERGIYDLLLTSTIGDGRESVEQIRNMYDTTLLVDLQNISEHDPKYGVGQTIRGNLTESVVGDVYSRIKYDISGVVDSFEDGVGSQTSFSEDKQVDISKRRKTIPDSNTISGTQAMLHLNFKPETVMHFNENTTFNNDEKLLFECGVLFKVVKTANTITKTTDDGIYKLYEYDDFKRVRLVEKGGGDRVESIINYEWGHAANAPTGSCLRASLPHAPGVIPEWVTYQYDGLGRLSNNDMLSHGGKNSFVYKGNTTTTVNDRNGWKKVSVDPIGKIRKVTVRDPEGDVSNTDYKYNNRGCLKEALLPRTEGTQQHTFTYDDAGRLVAGNRAESGHEEYTYNADGTLASRTDAKGQRADYFYNSKKWLTSIKRFDADGQIRPEQCVTYFYDTNPFEVSFSQNAEERLTAAQWGDENVLPGLIAEMYSYSSHGLIAAKRIRIKRVGTCVDIDLNYTYDNVGRISGISYTGGTVLTYVCDSMGRQSTLTSGSDVLIRDAVYSPSGFLVSFQQLIPGTDEYITETREINSRCQLDRIVAEHEGNPLVDLEYEYSQKDGRLAADIDRIIGERTEYDYDSRGRLKTVNNTEKDWETGFEYDGFGSLTTKKQKNGRGRSFEAKHNPRTNRVQMSEIEYDANGNIINHFGMKLSFDIENRLIEVRHALKGVEKYAYDKGNLRIWKKSFDGTEDFYLYGADNKLLATYQLMEDRSGDIRLSLTENNIYFANRLMRSHNEAVVLDLIGNVKASSNRNANRRMKYAPFGEENAATRENRIIFGTYIRDEISGLDYAKRRYYSPELGRFISPDPYIKSIHLDNPDSWNRYAYVENDPINNIDPNGTYCLKGYSFFCDNFSCPMYTWNYEEYDECYWPIHWCDAYYYDSYYGYVPYNPSGAGGGTGGGGTGGGGGGNVLTNPSQSINLSGLQGAFTTMWNNSFPNGNSHEYGGTIVLNANGILSIVNMMPGPDPSHFAPDYNVGNGLTVQGLFHTHPYTELEGGYVGVSFSGADAVVLINDGINVVMTQSGTYQFMYMRTSATPASVNYSQLNNAQNNRIAELQQSGIDFSEATRIAAAETAQGYGLAYYEGSNGVLARVYP